MVSFSFSFFIKSLFFFFISILHHLFRVWKFTITTCYRILSITSRTHRHTHTNTSTYLHTYVHACIHTRMHTRTETRIKTRIFTHIQSVCDTSSFHRFIHWRLCEVSFILWNNIYQSNHTWSQTLNKLFIFKKAF